MTNPFWDLYCELVMIVYATEPSERLTVVIPTLIERYGPAYSDTYHKIETHVLRTVAWMETMDE